MINVLTNRYSNSRTGVNGAETQLNKQAISTSTFGKLFTRTVDGDLYAQPLIVSKLKIGGKTHNVVYLSTSRNMVYAFDADDPLQYLPLWTRSLGPAAPRNVIIPDNSTYTNFGSEVGITSTPVIERAGTGGTLFLVAKTFDGRRFEYKLHALNILTGKDRKPPVQIAASVQNSAGSVLEFDPRLNLNRPGLLLKDGVIYIAFGSHADARPFYGWIMAYDSGTLAKLAVYNTAPDWGEGGVWQSGTGLAADDKGFVYAVVGNGEKSVENRTKGINQPLTVVSPAYGNAILKLKLDKKNRHLEVVDWFTACNTFDLNENDDDLIGGPVLFDANGKDGNPLNLVLAGGKDGKFYLTRRDDLGKWVPGEKNTNVLQGDDKFCEYHIHGAPVVWRRANGEIRAFVWSEKDFLREFAFNGERFGKQSLKMSDYGLPHAENRMPGGVLALSWDGNDDESAVVWALHPTDSDAENKTVRGTLRAYDALDLNNELWTSDMDRDGADRLGNLAKFCPPVIANGKVYISTFSRELVVYGLLKDDLRRPDDLGIFVLRNVGPNVQKSGSFACSKYDLTITGSGIGGTQDAFLLAYVNRNLPGLIQVTARVDAISAPNLHNAIAGVIIRRDDSTPGERFAAVVISNRKEALFLHRDNPWPTTNEATKEAEAPGDVKKAMVQRDGPVPVTFPIFVRIEASNVDGNPGGVQFTGRISKDGEHWEVISAVTQIQMDRVPNINLVAGIAVGLIQLGPDADVGPDADASVSRSHAKVSHVEVP